MGHTGGRLPGFCLNKVSTRARVRSPPANPISIPCHSELPASEENEKKETAKQAAAVSGRRIMVAGETSLEANSALQWALSHTIQCHDTILLLDVVKPSKHGGGKIDREKRSAKDFELLNALKKVCQVKKPEVQVELSLVEGKERGPTIVEEARKQGASLLVLGQKRRSITWRLLVTWASNRIAGGVADYCVQNSSCMALAVRRKSKRAGGYLITTKRHKDFWLLA